MSAVVFRQITSRSYRRCCATAGGGGTFSHTHIFYLPSPYSLLLLCGGISTGQDSLMTGSCCCCRCCRHCTGTVIRCAIVFADCCCCSANPIAALCNLSTQCKLYLFLLLSSSFTLISFAFGAIANRARINFALTTSPASEQRQRKYCCCTVNIAVVHSGEPQWTAQHSTARAKPQIDLLSLRLSLALVGLHSVLSG